MTDAKDRSETDTAGGSGSAIPGVGDVGPNPNPPEWALQAAREHAAAGNSAGVWRVVENPRDGTSPWEARVLNGDVLRAMFVDAAIAHEYVAWLNQPSAGAAEGERWQFRQEGDEPTSSRPTTWALYVDGVFRARVDTPEIRDFIFILAARAQAIRVADLELYKQAINSPYGECFTLPDGDCVGRGCMHDPQAQRVKALEAKAKLADEMRRYLVRWGIGSYLSDWSARYDALLVTSTEV